jgi:prolyl oligopeptidase
VTDVWHGVTVADPYRWLEDGDSSETAAWVSAQNAHTRQALDALPHRGRWVERLSALVALPTVIGAEVVGERLFVLERAAGADQFALVLRSACDPDAPPRVLLDPASLAADAAVAIDWFEPDSQGRRVALGLSEGGTEDSTLHVLDVDTGVLSGLRIPDTRQCSVAWAPDGSGFWYTCFPAGEQYHRHVRWHSLGADTDAESGAGAAAGDPVVFGPERLPTPETWPDVSVSPDGRWLLVTSMVGWTRSDVVLLDRWSGEWHDVVTGRDAVSEWHFGADGLVGCTTLDAPNGRVVTASLERPAPEHWRTVVAERADTVLARVVPTDDDLVVVSSRNAVDTVERWSVLGERLGVVEGLGAVTVGGVSADRVTGCVVLTVSAFHEPTAIHRLDGTRTTRWCPERPPSTALAPLHVTHTSYPSLDGTEIGLFVVHRADVTPGPDVPAVLNGYGGFAISQTPAWMPNLAAWCAEGGVWCIAGLRGGLEHGDAWHRAGRREQKQNVFDDFHSAGDWLSSTGRAAPDRLALVGGSNGGLLVGAALTQRPDLARAVWCAVPLLDMVRFPRFLIARLWTDEYGDPEVAEEFGWLHAWSPYHRVREGERYPAVLFTTADGDTRVDPMHARKMAAQLQHATAAPQERPVMLWQAGRSGHGVGKPAAMRVAEGADVLSFLWWQLGGAAGGPGPEHAGAVS